MKRFYAVREMLLLCAAAFWLSTAAAQSYPARSVRVIVPFPPAGGTDLFARTVSQKLATVLGQQFIVDNRSGAGGGIGSEAVARAVPDGYTLLITSSSTHSINPHLTRKPLYDPRRDFAPVIVIAAAPNVLVVHPSVPVKTVRELITFARVRPGQINYASNGSGTLSHLTGELFKLQTGLNLVHIPYKGGPPAVIDLVAGQVSALFSAFPTVSGQMRAGRLRALAVSGARRASIAPDLPTVAETIPGFESSQWWAMFAPAATPAAIVNRLNTETGKFLGDADMRERFALDGAEPVGGTPAEFVEFLRVDYEKWGKVVKQTGIRPD